MNHIERFYAITEHHPVDRPASQILPTLKNSLGRILKNTLIRMNVRVVNEVSEGYVIMGGLQNYSIYKDGFLFSYYEYIGTDYEADMAKMANDPETQRWWAVW